MRRKPSLLFLAALVAAASAINCSKQTTAPTVLSCEVSPSRLDFGTVPPGQAATRTFTVRNVGGGVLSGTVSVPTGPFTLFGSPTYSLSGGQSATETVQFTWQQAGAVSASISAGTSQCGTLACAAVGGATTCGVNPTTRLRSVPWRLRAAGSGDRFGQADAVQR